MSRSLGTIALTIRPAISISPDVAVSSPAMMLSKVDLPQPDGPTRTVKSPLSISRLMPFSTSTEPNRLCTSRTTSADMDFSYFTAPAVRPRTKYRPPNK